MRKDKTNGKNLANFLGLDLDKPKLANKMEARGMAANMDRTVSIVLNPERSMEERANLLLAVTSGKDASAEEKFFLISAILNDKTRSKDDAEYMEAKASLENFMHEAKQGPTIPATFVGKLDPKNASSRRIEVMTQEGHQKFPTCPPGIDMNKLKPGTMVYLDFKGVIVLDVLERVPYAGPEASFVRAITADHIEATLDDNKMVLHMSHLLKSALADGSLKRGDRILVCPKREFGFRAVPHEEDKTHRFVDNSTILDVEIDRDIGSPHWVLDYLITRTKVLLFHPEFGQQFDMRPRVSALLSGPSGTGKTLTIKGFLKQFVKMLRERTGIEQTASRVVRAKTSDLLSEWFGRTDKNIDELFDDVYDIVSKPVKAKNGEEVILPCVLVLEEAEGFGRRRGADHEGVYDRIIGTFLQRLDDPMQDLSKFPLIILATSNRPDLFDAAVWRRLSGVTAPFRRLDGEAFKSVLEKKLKAHFHYSVDDKVSKGSKHTNLRDIVVQHTTDEFYNNGDEPVLELVMADGRTVDRHVRNFMTGAVIEQTVANIIDGLAVDYQKAGGKKRLAITEKMMCNGIKHYVSSVVRNITAVNASEYLDVPDESRVTSVRIRV